MGQRYDVVVVGSGPNGLTASAYLASLGLSVLVVEADVELGGGMRSAECTLPGFVHDICSAVHTMGCLSPAFRGLGLEQNGLEWIVPAASVAHPLDSQDAVMLEGGLNATLASLAPCDRRAFTRLVSPFLEHGSSLVADLLAPTPSRTDTVWVERDAFRAWFGLRCLRG
jgi:phytoene dehydrogenase-like protein